MGEAIPKLHITKGVLICYLKVAVKRFFKRILINAFNATVCRSRCNVLAPIKPSCGKFHVVVSTGKPVLLGCLLIAKGQHVSQA